MGEAERVGMSAPITLARHAFVGRLDRWCELCNKPDRHPIHKADDGRDLMARATLALVDDFTVLDPIEPGYSVRVPSRAVLPASADEAVGDGAPYTDAQALVVVEDSDRLDLDAMEHERQSRLRRWQAQP